MIMIQTIVNDDVISLLWWVKKYYNYFKESTFYNRVNVTDVCRI